MPLTNEQALERFEEIKGLQSTEKTRLDRIRSYLRDDPDRRLQGLPSGVPAEVHRLARLSRVNMLKFIVNSRVQSMYVEGFRRRRADDEDPSWAVWQANGMDARQIGVHRAALAYGAAYVVVLPGDPMPVMRGVSPRNLTAAYDGDGDWPKWALEKRRAASGDLWRFYDNEAIYWIRQEKDSSRPEVADIQIHEATVGGEPVVPVIRYRATDDLDDPVDGIVESLIPLQDQLNLTTFELLVAQHYGAFRQRYILGWMAASEEQKLKASASKLWTFEEEPSEIQVGEFEQTDLTGYITSRQETVKHISAISQTPAHELTGQLVNLSSDALASAEKSKRAALSENQTVAGEGHEQTLNLVGSLMGTPADPEAYVRWRDTEARALGVLVDALGKMVQMLGVPPQALWERAADALGVPQQELDQWRDAASQGDSFDRLERFLDGQAAGGSGEGEPEPAVA